MSVFSIPRSPGRSIPVIVLAAGGSRRLRQPKQLVRHRGKSLLRHAAEVALAADVGPVLVVLGAEAELVAAELDGLEVERLVHPGWGEGLGSSIRVGVRAARAAHPESAGLLLMTCDQPRVDGPALRRLVQELKPGVRAVACAYGGTIGIPAVFAPSQFAALESLGGELGAKALLASAGALSVECPAAALDVDTAEDLEKLDA